jgi:sugar phosphate isomerase/epimerase
MDLLLSTNWNAGRQPDGSALIDEILALGFDAVELGYQLDERQAGDIRRRVAAGAVAVRSVHAYCPYPIGVPGGHPELYHLASRDDDERAMAVLLLRQTLEFAASLGARAVVVHAGRVSLSPTTAELIAAAAEDEAGAAGRRCRRLLERNRRRRGRRVRRHLDALCRSLDAVLPRFAAAKTALCLENLPSLEALPSADEMLDLLARYPASPLACWHDMGHAQALANLGWLDHRAAAERLLPHTRGLHIHDVRPPVHDHLPPGQGTLPFGDFAFYGTADLLRVLEPAPGIPAADLLAGARFLRNAWGQLGV